MSPQTRRSPGVGSPDSDKATITTPVNTKDTRRPPTGDGEVYEARPVNRRRATKAEMAERADELVRLAEENGPCSVRHLFYAATVAKVPGITKDDSGYGKVQRLALELRRAKRIPYRQITDGTRWMRKPTSYGSVADALAATATLYRRDLWVSSSFRVEVWCESDSIAGSIYEVTARWDVPLMVMRGQSSETFVHNAAEAWVEQFSQPVVLYVGDHDPAGLDIEEAARTKLARFYGDGFEAAGGQRKNARIDWHRVGVTWEQVERLDLPGTAPKVKNRRKPYPFAMSVEAEALPAALLRELLDEAITNYVDHDKLEVLMEAEESERTILHRMAGQVGR